MHVFLKGFYFSIVLQLSICLSTQFPHGQEEGVVKQKADRCGKEEGGGLKPSKNVRTSFMDGPLNKVPTSRIETVACSSRVHSMRNSREKCASRSLGVRQC